MTDIFRLQSWAYHTKTGNPTRKAILVALTAMADWTSARCEVKHGTLAEWVEVSESSIAKHLRKLEEDGLIARRIQYRVDGGQRGNEYLLLAPWITAWPDGAPIHERVGVPSAGSGPPHAPALGTPHAPMLGQEQPPLIEQPLGNNHSEQQLLVVVNENGDEPAKACWELPPTDDGWSPTYIGVSPDLLQIAVEAGDVWVKPKDGWVILDFWRDLYWHMEAQLTPSKEEAVKTALKHYPVEQICRAIAAGLKDKFIQAEGGPYDKLETLIAITSQRDNVDRLSVQVSEIELDWCLLEAQKNRQSIGYWRKERFDMIDDGWRFKNRDRLKREAPGRFNRYMAWSAKREAQRSAA